MTSKVPTARTITVDKRDIIKAIYELTQAEGTRTKEAAFVSFNGFGIKCSADRKAAYTKQIIICATSASLKYQMTGVIANPE